MNFARFPPSLSPFSSLLLPIPVLCQTLLPSLLMSITSHYHRGVPLLKFIIFGFRTLTQKRSVAIASSP
ncbi:hypothetical protein I3842_02G196700 [Carya illinoinensis]|uniref:Secreted protein n=1 Tax=Carya illinoinensis TaxID=32201 RepID=A0A922FY27_CARIL|nr:hypothetical protein I3842_02G196700 [Carya illinoinensis]